MVSVCLEALISGVFEKIGGIVGMSLSRSAGCEGALSLGRIKPRGQARDLSIIWLAAGRRNRPETGDE